MAYEERNGRLYFYKKERIGKRVVSTYYGTGEIAEFAALADEIRSDEARFERESFNREKNKQLKIDGDLLLLEKEIRKLIEAELIGLGFYKTASREWRIKKK